MTEAEGGRSGRVDERASWVLDATQELLERQGPERLTVQGIAERAGVSVGSLYRHFPSKEAIVAAVFRREMDRALEEMSAVGEHLGERSLRQLIEALVSAAVTRHEQLMRLDPLWVHEHLDDLALAHRGREGRAQVRRLSELLLLHYRNELREDLDLETALFLLSAGLTALVQTATREHPRLLASPSFGTSLVELVVRFLARDPGSPPPLREIGAEG